MISVGKMPSNPKRLHRDMLPAPFPHRQSHTNSPERLAWQIHVKMYGKKSFIHRPTKKGQSHTPKLKFLNYQKPKVYGVCGNVTEYAFMKCVKDINSEKIRFCKDPMANAAQGLVQNSMEVLHPTSFIFFIFSWLISNQSWDA